MNTADTLNRIASLDLLISNPARLMIIYLLERKGRMDYLSLMNSTGLSSGNITTHLGKLAQSGYVIIKKSFKGNKPHTAIELSKTGKDAYYNWAEQILAALPLQTITKLQKGILYQGISLARYQLIMKDWLPMSANTDKFAYSALNRLEKIPWPPREELWT